MTELDASSLNNLQDTGNYSEFHIFNILNICNNYV